MDVSPSKSTGAGEVQISKLLQAIPLSAKAKVLEVVALSRADLVKLSTEKSLPPQLLSQLASAIKNTQAHPADTLTNNALVKLQIASPQNQSTWALIQQLTHQQAALKVGSIIELSRRGDTLFIQPPTSNAQTSAQTSSASPTAQAYTMAKGNSEQATRNAETAILNQLLKLTLPQQDRNLGFISSLLPNITQQQPELARIALQGLSTPNKDAPELGRQIINLFQQLDKLGNQAPQMRNIDFAAIQTTLKQSGLFAEANTNSLAQNKSVVQQAPQVALSPSSNEGRNSNAPQHAPLEDIKLVLVSAVILLKTLSTTLSNSAPAQANALVDAMIRVLFQHRNTALSGQSKNLPTSDILAMLERLAHSSLARVLANQGNALLQLQSGETQAPLNFQTELLLKHNEHFIPVHFSLREERKKENDKSSKQNKKKPTWTVFLEWEFQDIGAYHSKIQIRDNELNASLWVENNTIKQKLMGNISKLHKKLEESGIVVNSLTCESQPLTNTQQSNRSSLIDVRT